MNANLNYRILANLERIIKEKNRERNKLGLGKIKRSDFVSGQGSVFYRLRNEQSTPNLSSVLKWCDVLEVDISEILKPI